MHASTKRIGEASEEGSVDRMSRAYGIDASVVGWREGRRVSFGVTP